MAQRLFHTHQKNNKLNLKYLSIQLISINAFIYQTLFIALTNYIFLYFPLPQQDQQPKNKDKAHN